MLRVNVRAHPGARHERVVAHADELTLDVWVRARPIEGQANEAIERAVAHALGLRPREVQLVSGSAQRSKVLELALSSLDELRERLARGTSGAARERRQP